MIDEACTAGQWSCKLLIISIYKMSLLWHLLVHVAPVPTQIWLPDVVVDVAGHKAPPNSIATCAATYDEGDPPALFKQRRLS
jgi:hypothetical protein